jgi:hypothetical protein
VADAVAYFLPPGQSYQFFAVLNAGGQRLFAKHVLPCLERILGHGKVLRVGRADVDGIDRRIAQDFAIIGRYCRDGKASPRCRAASAFLPAIAATSTDSTRRSRFQMHAAHEAGAEDCRPDWVHRVFHPRLLDLISYTHHAAPGCSRITILLRKFAALVNPSSGESRLSSCSIDSTES